MVVIGSVVLRQSVHKIYASVTNSRCEGKTCRYLPVTSGISKNRRRSLLKAQLAGYEGWVQCFVCGTNGGKEWHHSSLKKTKEICTQSHVRRLMLMQFWYYRDPPVEHCMFRGSAVASLLFYNLPGNHSEAGVLEGFAV